MSQRYLTITVALGGYYTARLFDKEDGTLLDARYTVTIWGAKWWARRWKPKPQPGARVWEGEVR